MRINSKPFVEATLILAALCLLVMPLAGHASASPQPAARDTAKSDNGLIRFSAGSHSLGFAPGKAYLAAMNHTLTVEFIGGSGVIPKSDSPLSSEKADKAPLLGKVTYPNLWEGISLTYEAAKDGITESIYHVAPGADVSKIALRYNVPVALRKDGSLRFKFDTGYMTESAPVAWQDIDGARIPVKVSFRVLDGTIGFAVGQYDKEHALVIDPTYAWHTFYGSTYMDFGYATSVDSDGGMYLTGCSKNTWTGPKSQAPIHAHSGAGSCNIAVIKLDSDGAYQWHTFFGSDDSGSGITTDDSGNVYVTGFSGATWNGPSSTLPLYGDDGGFYVLKLDSDGAYQWHTFLLDGGANPDDNSRTSIVYHGGYVYITGSAWSKSYDPKGPDGNPPLNEVGHVLVAKYAASDGTYQWYTWYSPSLTDAPFAITADSNGAIYVVGRSAADWDTVDYDFPVDPVHAHSGSSYDIFVLKLEADGTYDWHTFYGTVGSQYGALGKGKAGIGLDTAGSVYVTGYSDATWNGDSNTSPLHSHSGANSDLFVLKLTAGNGAYQWHTFYGGSGYDFGMAVATDSTGNVYVAGSADSWYGSGGESPLHAHSGNYDLCVLKLDGNGAYQWHTFYGSSKADYGNGMALDSSGNIYVAGYSVATWTADGTEPLHAFTSYYEFVGLKIKQQDCTYTISPTAKTVSYKGGTITVKVTASKSDCDAPSIGNSTDWITVSSNTMGKKSGTVKLTAAALDSSTARSESITIGGKSFTATQTAKACTIAISPTSSGTISSAASSGSFTVNASPSDCAWTAASGNTSWLTITSGSSGTGSGTVAYAVSKNTGKARSAKITATTAQNSKKKVYTVKQSNKSL